MAPAVSNLWLQHTAFFHSLNNQGFLIASVLLAENPYNLEYIKKYLMFIGPCIIVMVED
jgi:hypothetical protein